MLWVTMTTVYLSLRSLTRSSIASVEIGSRAEQGSSMSRTSGSTAMARAMHSRCCCPPDSPEPGRLRRSLTSFHRFAPRRARSARSSASVFDRRLLFSRTPEHVLLDAHGGERVGALEHHADLAADVDGVDARAVDVSAVHEHLAGDAGSGDDLVHAVECAQHCGFAAARGADERGHGPGPDLHFHAVDGSEVAVEDVEILDVDLLGH